MSTKASAWPDGPPCTVCNFMNFSSDLQWSTVGIIWQTLPTDNITLPDFEHIWYWTESKWFSPPLTLAYSLFLSLLVETVLRGAGVILRPRRAYRTTSFCALDDIAERSNAHCTRALAACCCCHCCCCGPVISSSPLTPTHKNQTNKSRKTLTPDGLATLSYVNVRLNGRTSKLNCFI